MSLSFRFLLSFFLSASILILISACGGGDWPENPETEESQKSIPPAPAASTRI